MTAETEYKVDRSGWAAGPWDAEPDRQEWRDSKTGFPCLAVRNTLGNWCGYVGITREHKFYNVGYSYCSLGTACPDRQKEDSWYCDHMPSSVLNVHGGITYSDKCAGNICHTPEPGEPDDVFWLGFDCAHCGDLVPGMTRYSERSEFESDDTYKDLSYIRNECADLAKQLAGMNETGEIQC